MKGNGRGVVLLTGAANGIGRATAEALGARGWTIGLLDRDADRLGEARERLASSGAKVAVAPADVVDPEGLKGAVAKLEADLGPTDVLVACAGVGKMTHVPDLDTAGLKAMLDVNVYGLANSFDAVLPGMIARGKGRLVGVSSVAGMRGMPWMASYSASKAAVWTYMEAIRPALKRRGIRLTTVFPGFVATGMTLDVPFANPVSMLSPGQAAAYMVKAIEKGPRDYVFPMSAALGVGWFLKRSPNVLFDWMMDRAGPRALTTDF